MFNGKNYKDTPEVKGYFALRPFWKYCPACGLDLPQECAGHDPCIKNCPGTDDACCGHGIFDAAYVTLVDINPHRKRIVLNGEKAIMYFKQYRQLPIHGVVFPKQPT